MIKIHKGFLEHKPIQTILSYDTEVDVIWLSLTEFGWKLIFEFIKVKLKGNKLGIVITPFISEPLKKQRITIFEFINKK